MRFAPPAACWILAIAVTAPLAAQTPPPAPPPDNFFSRSLHFTNRGIVHLYSKEQGGLERLTGMTAEQLGCVKAKCHVTSCDTCHAREVDGRKVYSRQRARAYEVCEPCHPVAKDDPDVHFSRGMRCMDCHSAREVHGDGTAYDSYTQPGLLDTRCENCHPDVTGTPSHTVHKGKLDCAACHVLEVVTCLNCHIDTRLRSGKDSSIQRTGMLFLVNHGGVVQPANLLTYVYGKRTMITVAPTFHHSITAKGRSCNQCHGTSLARQVAEGTLVPWSWKDGQVTNVEGVIPVVDGMRWNATFFGRDGERWVPLADTEPPLVNFSGGCTPLSREQLARLQRPQPGS